MLFGDSMNDCVEIAREFDRNMAKYLSQAQSIREDADYDAYDGITENIAKLQIKRAGGFMEESKKFL